MLKDKLNYWSSNMDQSQFITLESSAEEFSSTHQWHGVSAQLHTTSLAELLSQSPQLKYFELKYGEIEHLPVDYFKNNNELVYIDFYLNKLKELPEKLFQNKPKLEVINFYKNDFANLPENLFQGLSNLRLLKLDRVSLKELPQNLLTQTPSLQQLSLFSRDLETISKEHFRNLPNLEVLLFCSGKLTHLPEDLFEYLPNLRSLTLIGDSLVTLPPKLLQATPNLEELTVQGDHYDPKSIDYTMFDIDHLSKLRTFWPMLTFKPAIEQMGGIKVNLDNPFDNFELPSLYLRYSCDLILNDLIKFEQEKLPPPGGMEVVL